LFNSTKFNIQSDKTDELSHQILNITSFGNAKAQNIVTIFVTLVSTLSQVKIFIEGGVRQNDW